MSNILRMLRHVDVLSGITAIAIAAFFFFGGSSYEMGTPSEMGPGFIPRSLSIVLGALGIAILVQGMTSAWRGEGKLVGSIAVVPLAYVFTAMALFAFTLTRAGFVIACLLLLVVAGIAAPDRRWREIVVSAVALTALAVAVFVFGIDLAVPLFWSK